MDQHPSVNNLYLSERLQKTLAGIGSHTVTTVIAPMGYGKSTALKWWQQQLAARIPHAQVFRQLVAADSRQDFWDGFCRALRSRPVLAGQLQALGFPADPHTMRLLHELLQDALAGHPDPVFFMIPQKPVQCFKNLLQAAVSILIQNFQSCYFRRGSNSAVFSAAQHTAARQNPRHMCSMTIIIIAITSM